MIELLVTVAVLAILAALALPSFGETLRGWRRDSATKAFTTHLQFARAQAIKTSRKVNICSSTDGANCSTSNDWKSGWLVFVDINNNGTIDTGELIASQSAVSGVASMTATDSVKKLIFLPNGLLSEGKTTITVKPSGSTTTKVNEISIGRVGRAQVTSAAQS